MSYPQFDTFITKVWKKKGAYDDKYHQYISELHFSRTCKKNTKFGLAKNCISLCDSCPSFRLCHFEDLKALKKDIKRCSSPTTACITSDVEANYIIWTSILILGEKNCSWVKLNILLVISGQEFTYDFMRKNRNMFWVLFVHVLNTKIQLTSRRERGK